MTHCELHTDILRRKQSTTLKINTSVDTFLILCVHMGNQKVQIHAKGPPKQSNMYVNYCCTYCSSMHPEPLHLQLHRFVQLYQRIEKLDAMCFSTNKNAPESNQVV